MLGTKFLQQVVRTASKPIQDIYHPATAGALVAAKQSTTQPNCRCWVWFRGGLNEDSHWVSGWYGAPSTLGGIRIEKSDYVPCRVADWRVVFEEPADMKVGPEVPEGAQWKLVPTDPR